MIYMGEIMKSNNKQEIRCTMCNKVFDMWDIQEDFSLQRWIGYGSIHDSKDSDNDFENVSLLRMKDFICF